MLSAVRVLPAPPVRAPELVDAASQGGLYKVEPSRVLPVINTSKTIKSVLFSPAGLRRCNALLYRLGPVFRASTGPLALAVNGVIFVPASLGRWMALVATPLEFPALAATLLGMRFDMVVLLLRTYDFWYRALVSATAPVLCAASMGDARAIVAAGLLPSLLITILADANYRAMRNFVGLAVVAALVNLCTGLFLMVARIDDSHRLVVFHVYGRAVTAESVMANGCFLLTVLNLHNVYVRRQFASSHPTDEAGADASKTVQCMLFKSRLRWTTQPLTSSEIVETRPAMKLLRTGLLQLQCRGLREVFDARTTMVGASTAEFVAHQRALTWRQPLVRWQLIVAATTGLGTMHMTFMAAATYQSESLVHALSVTSLATTLPVVTYFICFVYQFDILHLLHTSFDFLFIFVQLLVAHVCLCDLCSWDDRTFALTASLLWIYWVLLVDAIPPITREKLRLNVKWAAILIETAMVVAFALFAFDLVAWKRQAFVDNELFRGVTNASASVANWSMGSIFLNRLATVMPWLGRSLWRLLTYEQDELYLLRGVVEYDDYEMHRRRNRSPKSALKHIMNSLPQPNQAQPGGRDQPCAGSEDETPQTSS